MNKAAVYGTLAVAAHAVVLVEHGRAHARLHISNSAAENVFILAVIVLAPVAAAILLWTSRRLAGAWLLLGSMAGSLVFGAVKHFVVASLDQVLHVPLGEWGDLFRITAVLLAITEVAGCGAGLWAVRRAGQTPRSADHKTGPA